MESLSCRVEVTMALLPGVGQTLAQLYGVYIAYPDSLVPAGGQQFGDQTCHAATADIVNRQVHLLGPRHEAVLGEEHGVNPRAERSPLPSVAHNSSRPSLGRDGQADELYAHTLEVLDAETAYGR